MRQIKFRGLRTDGKGFAYGLLRKQRQRDVSQSGNGVAYTGDWEYWIDTHEGEQGSWLVIPESIGQFTGLHDKNGVEIYEGDRCKVTYYNHIEKNSEIIQDVVFVDGGFALLKVGNTTSENLIEDDRTFVPLYYSQRPNSIEIIGSIHTNEKGQSS